VSTIRRSLIAAAAASTVALAAASGASAATAPVATTVCDGAVQNTVIRGDVFVPYDLDCTLTNVVVLGDVTTDIDAGVVTLDRTAVSGDVTTQSHRLVLRAAAVNGSVSATEARDGVRITSSVVRGDLTTKNAESELTIGGVGTGTDGNVVGGTLTVGNTFTDGVVSRNAVAGDLVLRTSYGAITVRRNVVRGTLDCTANAPAPVGGSNVTGAKTGQCTGL
jgi:hypothetical protein